MLYWSIFIIQKETSDRNKLSMIMMMIMQFHRNITSCCSLTLGFFFSFLADILLPNWVTWSVLGGSSVYSPCIYKWLALLVLVLFTVWLFVLIVPWLEYCLLLNCWSNCNLGINLSLSLLIWVLICKNTSSTAINTQVIYAFCSLETVCGLFD